MAWLLFSPLGAGDLLWGMLKLATPRKKEILENGVWSWFFSQSGLRMLQLPIIQRLFYFVLFCFISLLCITALCCGTVGVRV